MAEEIKEQEIKEETKEETSSEETAETAPEEKTEQELLQEKYDTLNNQYLRLAADFDNFRKRQAQEREALITFGAQECMKKVLEVADNFDRAIDMVEKIDNLDKMKETFHILNKQLTDSLTKLGLEQIKCVGEKFDPNLHEAVMQTPTDEYPEETIITEMQKGYKLGDKVLRPAMVSVAVKNS
ncbi:nucleotide exchange factor GrpE [bacterium]|nr:nucleotide exchange factor GrpE [bacterium]